MCTAPLPEFATNPGETMLEAPIKVYSSDADPMVVEEEGSSSDGAMDVESPPTYQMLGHINKIQCRYGRTFKVVAVVATAGLLLAMVAYGMPKPRLAEQDLNADDVISLAAQNPKCGSDSCPPPGCNCKDKCNQWKECQCDASSTSTPSQWVTCLPTNACSDKGFCPPKGCVCKSVCNQWNECSITQMAGCPGAQSHSSGPWVMCKKAQPLPTNACNAKGFCPPKGCVCKSVCNKFNECSITQMAGCPGAQSHSSGPWVMCKNAQEMTKDKLYNGFGKFPNGAATTFKLPCLFPGISFGDTPSADVSPCMYPEVTDAYAAASKQGVFTTTSKRVVKIYAHNFETAGLVPDDKHVFTKDMFEKAIAKINDVGMYKFLQFQAADYKVQRPTQAQWTKFTSVGFTSFDNSLNEAYAFFGVPNKPNPPGEIQLFVFPKFDTLGLSSRSPGPNSIFFRESSMGDLATAADTIAHELGHAFGLHHTFNGLLKAKLQEGTCGKCVPTASNGKTTGDGIADTSPTGSEFADDDKFATPVKDSQDYTKCTMKIDSSGFCTTLPGGQGNMRNIMSYDAVGCRFNSNSFTPLQLARMRCFHDQDMSSEGTAPGMPVLGPASVSGGAVSLGWLPPVSEVHCKGNGCVSAYKVERAIKGAWKEVVSTSGKIRSFEDKDVKTGSTYQYRVVAVTGNARRATGNSVQVVVT